MKKSGILMILISIIFLFFVNEYYRYDGYKKIEIPNIGTIRVPNQWYCSQSEDGLTYFSNMPIDRKGCKVYFVQYSITDNSSQKTISNEWKDYKLEDILRIEDISVSYKGDGNAYSNGSSYKACMFYLNDIKVNSYYVQLKGRNASSVFLIVDDSIDIKTMQDMTKWFKM